MQMEDKRIFRDEATGQLWEAFNQRGYYIDFKRLSDEYILDTCHTSGHGIVGSLNNIYRNKVCKVKYQYRSIFRPVNMPNPSE